MKNRREDTKPDALRIDGLRRAALGRGLIAIAGVAFATVSTRNAWGQQAKLAQSAVEYVDRFAVDGKDCDDCIHFIAAPSRGAPGTCRIVEGTINPHGHCIAFVPKTSR